MAKYDQSPTDFARVGFYSPDARRSSQMGRRMGFSEEQLQDPLFGKVGNTGAAYPLMLLAGALEESNDGDLVLIAKLRRWQRRALLPSKRWYRGSQGPAWC